MTPNFAQPRYLSQVSKDLLSGFFHQSAYQTKHRNPRLSISSPPVRFPSQRRDCVQVVDGLKRYLLPGPLPPVESEHVELAEAAKYDCVPTGVETGGRELADRLSAEKVWIHGFFGRSTVTFKSIFLTREQSRSLLVF